MSSQLLHLPNGLSTETSVPVGSLSIYDPIHIGFDEYGRRVETTIAYKNLLDGGEPGSGKSSLINLMLGHAALSPDARLWLFDGKEVELGPYRAVADVFVADDVPLAINALRALREEIRIRQAMMAAAKPFRRKIVREDNMECIVCFIDELAEYSATLGTKEERDEFVRLLRGVVNKGRAVGVIVVAATQRPSADIIPTSLRDIFGYRVAFRCTTDSSSDIILGQGWAGEGYSAKHIDPETPGVGLLLAEGGVPRRFKSGYLNDAEVQAVVDFARDIRST